ncbi:MAG: DNA mismatch repair endonuclease MutL, partial [Anaerolineae bacterium]|nr:DNA mismatch repair endonuclease MutL [Anaerolineae bacterium]
MPSPSRIHILEPHVAERIAAGEVVERPAAVVKELIENALDANASAISVEIEHGGLAMIRVSDDGTGIRREEAPIAFRRFATSKITTVEDLERVRTLGFRGEALAAIAAVSQVTMVTRTHEELEGTRIVASDGQVTTEPAASPVGCSVTVTNLYHNAPPRRKFLKSPLRESELCRNTVIRYALAFPHVAFRLRIDGRETLVAPQGTPLERLTVCLGREAADEMIPIRWEAADLRVWGFISRPTVGRSHRQSQYFYVNNRPIRAGLLTVALERAYERHLPPGRHPMAVIFIEVDPAYVDVNVHPTKAEVRFMHERSAYWAVSQAVTEALKPFPQARTDEFMRWPFDEIPAEMPSDTSHTNLREVGVGYHAGSPMRAIGQLHNSYILAQSPEGLVIIDPHAAHEAILFERLLRGEPREEISPAFRLPITQREAETLSKYLDVLANLGIEIEPFGKGTLVVRALPKSLSHVPLANLAAALVEEISSRSWSDTGSLQEALAARAACTAAIKAGDLLSLDQMQKLIDDLATYWSPAVCPHGRPAFITLSMEELERRFLRR